MQKFIVLSESDSTIWICMLCGPNPEWYFKLATVNGMEYAKKIRDVLNDHYDDEKYKPA